MRNQTLRPMTIDDLRFRAPSVFAEHRGGKTSERYTFIPTIRVVERLATQGWLPVQASEQRVKSAERRGFQKHMLRFRKYDGVTPLLNVGDSLVEMVLVNSHDGSSAYQLSAGLFRLVCSNGLVVADSTFENIRLKHQGFKPDDVLDASYRVIEEVPRIERDVKEMSSIQLTDEERMLFAESALQLKYEDIHKAPVKPYQLLAKRRFEDAKTDLWSTYNSAQENLLKGGLIGRNATTLRRQRTREVRGIDENIKLNKALWALAEGMRQIKERAA